MTARHTIFTRLAALADVIVVSGELMAHAYPEALRSETERKKLFDLYLGHCPGLIIFTSGSGPIRYGRRQNGKRLEMPPFEVEVVDSAGAGDSFRGGLIYGLLQGWRDGEMIRFANAVAALVCMSTPGCVNPSCAAARVKLS